MKRAVFPSLVLLGATLVTIAWRGPPPVGAWRLLIAVIGLGTLALVGALLVVQRLVPESRRQRDDDVEAADGNLDDADDERRRAPAAGSAHEPGSRARPLRGQPVDNADLQCSTAERQLVRPSRATADDRPESREAHPRS